MQTQMSCSAAIHALISGASPKTYGASGIVPASVDFIRAIGGAGGITLSLTEAIYATADPCFPTALYQTYFAVRVDAGAGPVIFNDLSGALFNGGPSWTMNNRYQWAIFVWNGVGWDVMAN
jgi:hypothetical protein